MHSTKPEKADLTWDPEGLLSSQPKKSYFAPLDQKENHQLPLDPEFLKKHPILRLKDNKKESVEDFNDDSCNKIALAKVLREKYMPLDLKAPGVKVLNIDPPIFTVDNFWSETECEEMIEAARTSGRSTFRSTVCMALSGILRLARVAFMFCRENEAEHCGSW